MSVLHAVEIEEPVLAGVTGGNRAGWLGLPEGIGTLFVQYQSSIACLSQPVALTGVFDRDFTGTAEQGFAAPVRGYTPRRLDAFPVPGMIQRAAAV